MIAKGKETNDAVSSRVYFTGVTPLKIVAINPTKKELEAIYGREMEKDPEYLSETDNIKKARIDFICQIHKNERIGVTLDSIERVSFFIEDRPRVGQESGKYQVINAYGETTWATKEEIQAGKLPENLSFYDTKGMRPAYVGEEELVAFIKQYLGIPNKGFKDKLIDNIQDAEIQLDDIKKYFSGNIKEITSAINPRKDTNIVKLCAGIKTTDDNKQYIVWFIQKPLKYIVSDYKYLLKEIKDRQSKGAYPNVNFGKDDLQFRIYENEPSDIQPVKELPIDDDLPFGSPSNGKSWFDN